MSEDKNSLPALPEGWVWTTLEEISEVNPRIDKESINEDLEVTFLPMKSVEEITGKIDLSLTREFSEVKKGYTPFKDNDIRTFACESSDSMVRYGYDYQTSIRRISD